MAKTRTVGKSRSRRARLRDGLVCLAVVLATVSGVSAAALEGLPALRQWSAPPTLRLSSDPAPDAANRAIGLRGSAPNAEDRAPPQASPTRPVVALVIDDLGPVAEATRAAIALPAVVTLSFLPYGDHAPALAQQAAANGHEVILHLPMQPMGREDPGPRALRTDLPAAENIARLTWAWAQVPGADGINNHMGSRFTATAEALAPVLESLSGKGIFFLDSRTTARSQVVVLAHRFGVESAGRDVFLDDAQTPAYIRGQLDEAVRIAGRQGVAIAIGHPHAATLAVLRQWLASAAAQKVNLVKLRTAIALKQPLSSKSANSEPLLTEALRPSPSP